MVRQDCQRGIVTHRADRLFPVQCHRRQKHFQVFLRKTESLLPIHQWNGRLEQVMSVFFQLMQTDTDRIDPCTIWPCVGVYALDFAVVDDAPGIQIDQKHLAGLQAPFLDDVRFRNRQYARFRSHDDQIVIGDDITGRTQTIPVEQAPNLAAVCKGNRCRTIPRFHHGGMVFIKGTPVVFHQRVVFPGLRNHHHHGMRQRITRHDEQLERVVETRCIRLVFIHEWIQFLKVIAQNGRIHQPFTCAEPVEISLDGIDLPIMRNQAVRVSEWPLRKRIRGKALVH